LRAFAHLEGNRWCGLAATAVVNGRQQSVRRVSFADKRIGAGDQNRWLILRPAAEDDDAQIRICAAQRGQDPGRGQISQAPVKEYELW
jgi:hypothetical protein